VRFPPFSLFLSLSMAFVRRVRWSFFPLLSKALEQNGIDTKNHLFTRSPLRVNERTEGRQQRYEENERVRRARDGKVQGEAQERKKSEEGEEDET
jgi:hypothetical protein